jgi:hypothetical protein
MRICNCCLLKKIIYFKGQRKDTSRMFLLNFRLIKDQRSWCCPPKNLNLLRFFAQRLKEKIGAANVVFIFFREQKYHIL